MPAPPWTPFVERDSAKTFIRCASTYRDNPLLDGEAYRKSLEAACAGDEALLRAWRDGAWDALSAGAYFSGSLSWDRNSIRPWPTADRWWDWQPYAFRFYLSHDLGWTSPSCTFVCARSSGGHGPDNRYYPAGSIILLDELYTCQPGHYDKGLNYTTAELCELIRSLAARWNMRPRGIADDQILSTRGGEASTYADDYEQHGVSLSPARKGDRVSGWARLRTLMKNAGNPEEAGLYVSRTCQAFWATVPNLQRDPRNPEDVQKCGTDHAGDCARYAVLEPRSTGSFSVSELHL
jgi:hypothetical protein